MPSTYTHSNGVLLEKARQENGARDVNHFENTDQDIHDGALLIAMPGGRGRCAIAQICSNRIDLCQTKFAALKANSLNVHRWLIVLKKSLMLKELDGG